MRHLSALALILASTSPSSASEERALTRTPEVPPMPSLARPRMGRTIHVPLLHLPELQAQVAAAEVPADVRLAAAEAKRARRRARNLANLPSSPTPEPRS